MPENRFVRTTGGGEKAELPQLLRKEFGLAARKRLHARPDRQMILTARHCGKPRQSQDRQLGHFASHVRNPVIATIRQAHEHREVRCCTTIALVRTSADSSTPDLHQVVISDNHYLARERVPSWCGVVAV